MYFQDVILGLQKFWAKKGCVLVQPYDMDEMIQRANELYQNLPLRRKLAQNARKYAENNFDIRSIALKFEALLDGYKNSGQAKS